MVALRSLIDDEQERAELEREIAACERDVHRFRSALARPEVTGSWAEKIGWQLEAAERGLARLRRLAA